MRDSSSRSITIWSNRRTWPTTTSSACWLRSGRSPRRLSSTSTAAASAVIGRAQLVGDVGREADLALDPGLHRVGHPVERAGQQRQVGVGLGGHARVETARGDLAGGVGHPGERAQQPPARPPAEAGGEQGGHAGTDGQRGGEVAQRAVRVGEREGLEVLGVRGADVHADGQIRVAVEREALLAALFDRRPALGGPPGRLPGSSGRRGTGDCPPARSAPEGRSRRSRSAG